MLFHPDLLRYPAPGAGMELEYLQTAQMMSCQLSTPATLSRANLPTTFQGHVSWRTGHTVRLPGIGHSTYDVCRWLQGRLWRKHQ